MSRSIERRIPISLFRLLLLVVLLAACTGQDPAPSNGEQTTTGFSVAPEFRGFYEDYGGARVFGFPISAAFVDLENGRLTQYFQQFRLEFERTAGVVAASPLGEFYAPPETEQILAPQTQNGRVITFPETGYTVQGAFLTFFEEHGGEVVFGPPISPQLDEGGKLVQYFQNALLVWNPNAPPEFRVEVAALADAHYWQFGGPETGSFTLRDSTTVPEADVRAAVKEPILYAGEEQVLYVTVITPDSLQLVEGATVSVTVSYDDLSTNMIFANPTDEFGQSQHVLELPGVEPGDTVQVEIEAIGAAGVLGRTMLSFKTWW